MNRRLLVVVIGVLAIIVFAVAALLMRPARSPVAEPPRVSVAAPTPTVSPSPQSAALVRFHSPVIGRADAPVTIVEFFDPSCEACRAFHPYVKQILGRYPQDVRVVIRYVLFHKGSEETVRMLEAARRQGRFEAVLDAILRVQPDWHDDPTVAAAWRAAVDAGLDEARARVDMKDAATTALITTDSADVQTVGIRGTPTFFINGARLDRLDPQTLQQAVEQALPSAQRPAR